MHKGAAENMLTWMAFYSVIYKKRKLSKLINVFTGLKCFMMDLSFEKIMKLSEVSGLCSSCKQNINSCRKNRLLKVNVSTTKNKLLILKKKQGANVHLDQVQKQKC